MKLSPIKKEHVITASEYIDYHGVPTNQLFNNYWVEVNEGEYPFKHLTRIAYQMTEGNQGTWLKFQSNKSYRGYMESLGLKINYYKEGLSFITKDELEFFDSISGSRYRKDNEEHRRKGDLLKPLVRKINLWAEKSCIEDFNHESDNHWQWSGVIKPYLWIRIRRPNSHPGVYFTVGCNGMGGLFLKIDCRYSNYTSARSQPLPEEKIQSFNEYLKSNIAYQEVTISKEVLHKYNWDKLIEGTQQYLHQHASLYDELEAMISGHQKVEFTNSNKGLFETPPPSQTKSYASRKRSFTGKETNWERKLSGSIKLGNAGESLVINYEQERLKKAGLHHLADQVEKVMDGSGYDIRSYDEKGNELHIEVKTTQGDINEPFQMSLNEREYLREHPQGYYLYRVYHYQFLNESGRFYRLTATELEDIDFTPTSFEVSIKERNED